MPLATSIQPGPGFDWVMFSVLVDSLIFLKVFFFKIYIRYISHLSGKEPANILSHFVGVLFSWLLI